MDTIGHCHTGTGADIPLLIRARQNYSKYQRRDEETLAYGRLEYATEAKSRHAPLYRFGFGAIFY